jgi:Protein of unknown function (DUF998)
MCVKISARMLQVCTARHIIRVRGPALAGIIGPILFWLALIVLGQTQSAYSALRSDISLLSLGANGWIQTVNFVIFGLLVMVFQMGLQRAVAPGKAWGLLNIVALAFGLGLLAIAVFPTDRVGTWTVHGIIHLGIVVALALVLPLICLMTAARLKPRASWRGYAEFSVFIGVVVAVLTVMLLLAWSGIWPALHPWLGLYERMVFALPSLWMEVMALRLLKNIRAVGTSGS